MLDKLFSKALTLVIDEQEISFTTLAEFEFALGGRTNVPATKLADLIMLSPDDLKREAKSIKKVEKRFVDILSESIERPGEIGRLVRDIDIQVFSNDYEWRAIFKALNRQPDVEYDELRRVAVVKYMQYLRSRQDVIKQTYKVKMKEARRDGTSVGGDSTSVLEETKDTLKETSIFDSISLEAPLDLAENPYTRLPKGEAVQIFPAADKSFEFRLSKHVLTFNNTSPATVIDEQGDLHELNDGKNIVGRDAVCNVVVGKDLRDVSRMHLIIEHLDGGGLRFTDLSSHGTFLPTELVPATDE